LAPHFARNFKTMHGLRYLPLWLTFACSADPIQSGHYLITLGQETDTLTMSPAPVSFTLTAIDASSDSTSGNSKVLQTSNNVIDTIDVGYTGSNFFVEQGVDSAGVRRVQAESFALDATTMAGYSEPLFLGRTDAFCRPAGALQTVQGNHPPVGIFWDDVLWIAGIPSSYQVAAGTTNNQVLGEGYDLIGWDETPAPSVIASISCPISVTPPCPLLSIANYTGRYGLGIGSNWAVSVDIAAETLQTVDPASAGIPAWSDVAGGRTINAPTGAVFVVGAARNSSASSYVLELATDGTMKTLTLSTARQFAAATYIKGQGLLVVGGSADPNSAGAEFLAEAGTSFSNLTYLADPVTGAALVAEPTGSRVWRMGGQNPDGTAAPTVVYDLAGCTAPPCTLQPPAGLSGAPFVDLPVTVTNSIGFSYSADSRLIIGEQLDGTMVAWRVNDTGVTTTDPIPLREPRRSSTIYGLPNGFAALIGGTLISDGTPATTIELLAY
jgi:hypothetical protein